MFVYVTLYHVLSVCLICRQECFEEQISKHSRLVDLLNQNMAAQANILRALTEANAKFARIRRDLLEVNTRSAVRMFVSNRFTYLSV